MGPSRATFENNQRFSRWLAIVAARALGVVLPWRLGLCPSWAHDGVPSRLQDGKPSGWRRLIGFITAKNRLPAQFLLADNGQSARRRALGRCDLIHAEIVKPDRICARCRRRRVAHQQHISARHRGGRSVSGSQEISNRAQRSGRRPGQFSESLNARARAGRDCSETTFTVGSRSAAACMPVALICGFMRAERAANQQEQVRCCLAIGREPGAVDHRNWFMARRRCRRRHSSETGKRRTGCRLSAENGMPQARRAGRRRRRHHSGTVKQQRRAAPLAGLGIRSETPDRGRLGTGAVAGASERQQVPNTYRRDGEGASGQRIASETGDGRQSAVRAAAGRARSYADQRLRH
jgi:hypothetical protein